jgi:hypothetical protein
MTFWDWMFVFFLSAVVTIGGIIFMYHTRPQTYPKDWITEHSRQQGK